MHLWKVYRGPMLFLLFTGLATFLVVREYALRDLQHAERREELLYLLEQGYAAEAGARLEVLADRLSRVSTRALADDLERLRPILTARPEEDQALLHQYHQAVAAELEQRLAKRLPTSRQPKAPTSAAPSR